VWLLAFLAESVQRPMAIAMVKSAVPTMATANITSSNVKPERTT